MGLVGNVERKGCGVRAKSVLNDNLLHPDREKMAVPMEQLGRSLAATRAHKIHFPWRARQT